VIAAPFADGAVKETVAAPLLKARPVPTSTAVGLAICDGTDAVAVTELLTALLGALVPFALFAFTVKVYEVPTTKSEIVNGELAPVALNPPDTDSTV
jgi:hypothetical protein